jgi:hypothetical protein
MHMLARYDPTKAYEIFFADLVRFVISLRWNYKDLMCQLIEMINLRHMVEVESGYCRCDVLLYLNS